MKSMNEVRKNKPMWKSIGYMESRCCAANNYKNEIMILVTKD